MNNEELLDTITSVTNRSKAQTVVKEVVDKISELVKQL